jgi:hypothetical protein
LSDERGQVLPLAVVMLLVLLLLAVPVLSAGWLLGTRSAAQRAADAAALAGAGQAVLAREVDARGAVYCARIAVNPVGGPAAAARYWTRNTAALASIRTRAFVAVPDGALLTVQATVAAANPLWAGQPATTWTVTAVARVQQPPGIPACPNAKG